jgi:CBS domain-containing protein
MQCKDVMLNVVFNCSETATVAQAAKLMRDENIGFVPIVGSDGTVAGVLTDRDLAIRVVADQRSTDTAVRDVMTAGKLLTCLSTEDLGRLEEQMMAERKSRALVVDEIGKLVGIISLSDIARVEQSARRTGRLLKEIAHRESASIARP